jgi:hypothetical protein
MKALKKHFNLIGNTGFVQFETPGDEECAFKPAGPALENGGLVITESAPEGVVGKLLAINNNADFLLLTDMDILKGSKQNRVVNTSVLFAPESKTIIDVSCVERLRWNYTSPSFKLSVHRMDYDMRSAKAAFVSNESQGLLKGASTQSRIWSIISDRVGARKMPNSTEDYVKELVANLKTARSQPKISDVPSCNALMIFTGHRFFAMDLFGNREAYRYYFPGIIDSAYLHQRGSKSDRLLTKAEAFYKLDEYLDELYANLELSEVTKGVGKVRRDRRNYYPGFELSYENKPVHLASFSTGREGNE